LDWIDAFIEDTEPLSGLSFRTWTAISIIGAALERRAYTYTWKGILYPNLYTFLAGGPGSGKSIMVNQARNFFLKLKGFHLGPDSPTRRSLLDKLQSSIRNVGPINGFDVSLYTAMYLASTELGVLISKYDTGTLSDLSDLYDCRDKYTAPRASTTDVEIEKPTLNILGAVTHDFIGELFPDLAWGQGFTSRIIFVYGIKHAPANPNRFARPKMNYTKALNTDLAKVSELGGEFIWTDDAQDAFQAWASVGMPPIPTYERLKYYLERREVHFWKLSMISAVSRTGKLTVETEDVERAKQWLIDAELTMPDVFRAIAQKSNYQLIRDLHQHFYAIYTSLVEKKRQPIPEENIKDWLAKRVTSNQVQNIFDTAVDAGYLSKSPVYSAHWIPRRMDQVGDIL